MARFRPQRIRDPLHDLIEFEEEAFENVMWNVIQTRPFQRLRRVKQLGFSELVYPGATHNRMSHSIGVYHVARALMDGVRREQTEKGFDTNRANVALAAALVHDVGHGPFSHSFESVGKRLGITALKHELTSAKIIRETEVSEALARINTGFSEDVASLIERDGPTDIYSSVVTSQFDADRLDYMRRDRLMTGTQHSEIDFTWLMANLKIGTTNVGVDDAEVGQIETLVLDKKALFAAEGYVLGLFHLYQTIYLHKATRSAEKIFTELLLLIVNVVQEAGVRPTGLPSQHPLIRFAKKPDDLNVFLCLDDTTIWGALPLLCDASHPDISRLSKRLYQRKLWKALDLWSKAKLLFDGAPESASVERVVKRAKSSLESWLDDDKSPVPRMVIDSYSRSPYKRFREDAGPLNQIFLDFEGNLVDIVDVSQAVSGLSDFKIDRVYREDDDAEVAAVIKSALKEAHQEELKNAA